MIRMPFVRPWESAIAVLHDRLIHHEENNDILGLAEEPDRRSEPRFSLSLPVYHRIKTVNSTWKSASPIDVSQNGIRLALSYAVPIGSQMEMDIKLPNSAKPVRMQGVVVWKKPSWNGQEIFEYGVAFENLRQLSRKEKLIQFMADRLCQLAMRETYQMKCRPAVTKEDLNAAYRLVYDEYRGRGYCPENSSQLHYTFYCLLPESRTFLLEMDRRVVGTISLIADSDCGLPLETLFADKIGKYRGHGRKLAEVSLLALDHHVFGKKSFALTDFKKLSGSFRLFKIMFDYARLVSGVTDLFIGMHPKHQDLYEYLTFETIGPVREYAGAQGNPALPMRMDVGKTILTIPRHLGICKYFIEDELPSGLLNQHFPWDQGSASEFLLKYRNIWQEMKSEYREFLRGIYPELPSE